MRRLHSITPGLIHQHAREALRSSCDWKAFHQSVSVDHLLDLLLLMAASTASLFATVRRFFSFSHQTASLAVKANLPDRKNIGQLTRGLVTALYQVAAFSRQDRWRRWMVAIDIHLVPYYGRPTPDVVGGPKKQGTKWFFAYATAVLLHKRRRYTIALEAMLPQTKPHDIVRLLLDQIAAQGLKIGGVTLDSAFDSGDTLLLLQERQLAYSIPLRWFAGSNGPPKKRVGGCGHGPCSGRAKPKRWCSPSRAGAATALATSINKRTKVAACTGGASASKRATGKRTKLKPARPAGIPSIGSCWKASPTCSAKSG
jgi:hypothetical protein